MTPGATRAFALTRARRAQPPLQVALCFKGKEKGGDEIRHPCVHLLLDDWHFERAFGAAQLAGEVELEH
jgi:hypothetical protein